MSSIGPSARNNIIRDETKSAPDNSAPLGVGSDMASGRIVTHQTDSNAPEMQQGNSYSNNSLAGGVMSATSTVSDLSNRAVATTSSAASQTGASPLSQEAIAQLAKAAATSASTLEEFQDCIEQLKGQSYDTVKQALTTTGLYDNTLLMWSMVTPDKFKLVIPLLKELENQKPNTISDMLLEPTAGTGATPMECLAESIKSLDVALSEGVITYEMAIIALTTRDANGGVCIGNGINYSNNKDYLLFLSKLEQTFPGAILKILASTGPYASNAVYHGHVSTSSTALSDIRGVDKLKDFFSWLDEQDKQTPGLRDKLLLGEAEQGKGLPELMRAIKSYPELLDLLNAPELKFLSNNGGINRS